MYIINNIDERITEKGKVVTINNVSGDIELYNCAGIINTVSGDVELNSCKNISVNSVYGDVYLFDTMANKIDIVAGWLDLSNTKIKVAVGNLLIGQGEIEEFFVRKKRVKFNLFNPLTWFTRVPELSIPKDIIVKRVHTNGKVFSFTPVEIVGRGKNIILKEKL